MLVAQADAKKAQLFSVSDILLPLPRSVLLGSMKQPLGAAAACHSCVPAALLLPSTLQQWAWLGGPGVSPSRIVPSVLCTLEQSSLHQHILKSGTLTDNNSKSIVKLWI